MTVEVERTFEVDAPIEDVWELLADETNRARSIEVVEEFDTGGEETIWQIALPLPVTDRTISVRTWDIERDSPNYVEFVGRSKAMDVVGEHELTETETGCRVHNRFVVDGKLPGVERFFERRIDDEIENIRQLVVERDTGVEEVS
jgi:carbon monoxide dehydrogenase subunit G